MLSLDNVLFLDTEHNEDDYSIDCVQVLYRGKAEIITEFSPFNLDKLKSYFNNSDAIITWNGLFDGGKLATLGDNTYRWVEDEAGRGAYWELNLFGNIYRVRRIGGHRNLVKCMNREKTEAERRRKQKGTPSTPFIDMLKLWSILIESDNTQNISLALKDTLKRHGYKDIIKYSKENAKTEAYRLQDVYGLKYLTEIFLNKIESILDLKNYTWKQWSDVKSPATFTKWAYERRYNLKEFKEHNEGILNSHNGLRAALEQAYKGGITISMHRGKIENTGWVDIKSAYANTIKHFNTDRFLMYDVLEHDGSNWDYKKTNCLLRVRQNFCIESINKSLKMFKLSKPATRYVWYDDIEASKNFYEGYECEILGGFEFIPLVNCKKSLVEEWVACKEEEGLKDRNITLYEYYKFLSNTSYGIKAQRTPFETVHTNMAIAGMITANVHRILSVINKTVRDVGYRPLYNDTDSCCFSQGKVFTEKEMDELITEINRRIYPYMVDGEGFNKTTTILSLKRYISIGGTGKDKVRLHGKGRYNIYETDTRGYIEHKIIPEKQLMITNLAGNTERTLKQLLKLAPQFIQHAHPFMFIKNVPTDRSIEDFMIDWYTHIDTKMTKPEGDISADLEFERDFREFDNIISATLFYGEYIKDEADDMGGDFRDWDAEIEEDFIC